MTTVQTYGNVAEACLAKSLLESAGIRAELADEHTYGLGYGPVVCELRLQVEEGDLERARKVLAEGPDALASPEIESTSVDREAGLAPKGSRFPAGIFVAGGIAFLVLLFYLAQYQKKKRQQDTSLQPYEYDYDKDGRADYVAYYLGRTLVKETFDRNHDGRPDAWAEYDSREVPRSAESDNNFDGIVDVWYEYRNGRLTTESADTDFNGVPDVKTEYKNELPIRSVYKPNGSTTASLTGIYTHGLNRGIGGFRSRRKA